MSQELKKLKNLGAQKIHEDTHIAFAHVQSVIHESFEDLEKIQFIGFISILEREYSINLSSLKEKGLVYFSEKSEREHPNTKIFVSPKKSKNFTWFYVSISILIFIFAVYYTTTQSAIEENENKIDNSAIENATTKIIPKLEKYEQEEQTAVVVSEIHSEKKETPIIKKVPKIEVVSKAEVTTKIKVTDEAKELIITPKSRVWIGYINKKTGKKRQTVTRNKIVLDASQTWLLSLGHTHVKIKIDDKNVKVHSSNKSMRFIYKNKILKSLTANEFKKLNKGRIW